MSSTDGKRLGPAEYLARERAADFKSEFYDGEMFAMAGGTPTHGLIGANLIRCVGNALVGHPCRIYTGDVRIAVPTGLYTYPDASIVCGPEQHIDHRQDTLTNPVVLFEVLSPSTEAYDRGKKFQHYRHLPSLRAYVLVSQDRSLIECFVRNADDSWTLTSAETGTLHIAPVEVTLRLDEIFAGVEFPPEEPAAAPA